MRNLVIVLMLVFLPATAQAERNKVIETIAYESSSECFLGQVAVASVIKRRMIERHKTATQIVLQRKQFSCWINGKPAQRRTISRKEYNRASKAWNQAKPTKYNHYARYDCKPYWIKSAKSQERIGNHVFYEL